MNLKGLIISSGDILNYEGLKSLADTSDYILCADGGLRHAKHIGVIPNSVIGDFDSINKESMDFIHQNKIPMEKFPAEKDETDTELALRVILELGYKDVTIVGGTGSRLDHTLANIFLLRKLLSYNAAGRIMNNNNTVYLVNKELVLEKREGYFISILPINSDGVKVTLEGFYYPLKDQRIDFGSTLGVSNVITKESGIISVLQGEAIVIEAKD